MSPILQRTRSKPDGPHSLVWELYHRVWYYVVFLMSIVLYVWMACYGYEPSLSNPYLTGIVTAVQFPILCFQIGLCLLCFLGMLLFGAPADKRPGPDWAWDKSVKLIVAYVSRGNQPGVIKRASGETQAILDQLNVEYAMEVVTDVVIPAEKRLARTNGEIFYYTVPEEYQTSSGARFKARALQFLLEQRNERLDGRENEDNVWILHLDEESIITPECILGIRNHIEKYDLRRTDGAIGQGEIMYNSHNYGENLAITAIDSVRTGQDLGLFRLSFKTHMPLIGMHGSYVLVPASIEQSISWDVGGSGSVTEDAFFALTALQRGVRFDWVEGFIREQSPFTFADIARQRRRWFCGLRFVAFDPALELRTTLFLRLVVLVWGMGCLAIPLPFLYISQKLIYGTCILPVWLFVTCAICWGMYASQYCLGTYRNLLHSKLPLWRKVLISVSSIVVWLLNIPTVVESTGAMWGLLFPVKTFYVVAKDDEEAELALEPVGVANC